MPVALTFPTDLTEKYYFDLKFMTYSRPNPYTGKINLAEPAIGAAPGSGNIRLPIPANVVDTQKLSWRQEANMDGVAGVGAELVGGNMEEALGGISGMGAALAHAISSGVASMVGERLVGNPADYFMQKAGLALNPVLTQTFKHPEFKEHQFSWTLAPESQVETYVLQSIINTIKQQSLPDIQAGGAFFSYPSIALVNIHTGNNEKLYNFQPCVVTAVTANYAPKGVPSFFKGTNAPTMVKLDISLLEIILNTRSNMNGENDQTGKGFDFSFGGLGSNSIKSAALDAVRRFL